MADAQRKAAYARGVDAEKCAIHYLLNQGFSIVHERYKCRYGEIDIIAETEEMLLFIEVKARKHHDAALECITPRQQKRIVNAAQWYMSELQSNAPAHSKDQRFDVITVDASLQLSHLKHAFDVTV